MDILKNALTETVVLPYLSYARRQKYISKEKYSESALKGFRKIRKENFKYTLYLCLQNVSSYAYYNSL